MLETRLLNGPPEPWKGGALWWRRQCVPEAWILFEPHVWAFVACIGPSYYDRAVALAESLGSKGLCIEYSLGSKQFSKQVRHCTFTGAEMLVVGNEIHVRDPLLDEREIPVPSESYADLVAGFGELEKAWR